MAGAGRPCASGQDARATDANVTPFCQTQTRRRFAKAGRMPALSGYGFSPTTVIISKREISESNVCTLVNRSAAARNSRETEYWPSLLRHGILR